MTLSAHHRALACLVFTLGIAASIVPAASAQTDTTAADAAYVPTLTFDVVSIHESKDDFSKGIRVGGPNSAHASLVALMNYRATDLVAMAYGLDSRNVSGGPDWASSTRFYVNAKSDISVDDALAKLTDKQGSKEKQHMLQIMLADRFQLKLHEAQREATVFELVIAKDGPKLREAQPEAAPADGPKDDTPKKPSWENHCDDKGCELKANRFALDSFARMLSGPLNTTVTNKTGLTANYEFTLQWRSDSLSSSADSSPYPLLLNAVKEQLGLELKPVKGTVRTAVIDHIEKPSEN